MQHLSDNVKEYDSYFLHRILDEITANSKIKNYKIISSLIGLEVPKALANSMVLISIF